MKTKLLLTFLIGSLLVSCNHLFHQNDDDGNPNDDQFISEYNYTYEGDFYKYYLNSEKAVLDQQILTWEELSPNDPGYDATQDSIIVANNNILELNAEISAIPNILGVQGTNGIGLPPRPVPPPLPCEEIPYLCYDFLNLTQYILVLDNISQISVIVRTGDGQILQNTNTDNALGNVPYFQGQVQYQTFNNAPQQYVGDISIEVTRLDNLNNSINYTIYGYMYQP